MKNLLEKTRQTSTRSSLYFIGLCMGMAVSVSSCSEKNVVPSSSLASEIQAGEKTISINGVKAQVVHGMLHFDTYQAAEEARAYFGTIAAEGEPESLKSKVGALHFSQSLFYKFEQLKSQYGAESALYAQATKALPKVGSFVDYQVLLNQDGAYSAGNMIYLFDKEGNIYSIEKLDYNLLNELKKADNPLALAKQKGIYIEEKAIRDVKLANGDATSPQTEESYDDTQWTDVFYVNRKPYRFKVQGEGITRHPLNGNSTVECKITAWVVTKSGDEWKNFKVDQIKVTDGLLRGELGSNNYADKRFDWTSNNKNFIFLNYTAYGPSNQRTSPWKNLTAEFDIKFEFEGYNSPKKHISLDW